MSTATQPDRSSAAPLVTSDPVLALSVVWAGEGPESGEWRSTLAGLEIHWSVIDRYGARGIIPLVADASAVLEQLGEALAPFHDDLELVRADHCVALRCALPSVVAGQRRAVIDDLRAAGIDVEHVLTTSSSLTLVVAEIHHASALAVVRGSFIRE